MADLRAALSEGVGLPGPHGKLDIALALGLFALSMAWFSLTLASGLELRDEGHLYSMSARVGGGAVPHRDFVDIYGPGVFWLTGLVLELFDGRILAVRVGLGLLKAFAVSCTYLVGRNVASRPLAFLGALAAIALWGRRTWTLNAPYASLFTVPLLLLALLLLLRALRRESSIGFASAGFVAGASVLFKQSVGLFGLVGFGLAILGNALAAPGREPERRPVALIVLFGVAGFAVLVPFFGHLTAADYALHFLPLHLFMLGLAASAWRCGARSSLGAVFREQALPFALGAALPLVVTAALYAAWGGLGTLVYDMFGFPMTVPGYAQAIEMPARGAACVAAAALAATVAVCFALGGQTSKALVGGLAALGLAALAVVFGDLPPLARLPGELDGVLLPALLWLALAALGSEWLAPDDADRRGSTARIAIVFFSATLVVQVYPRAGFNVWLLAAALVPLVVMLASHALALAGDAPARRFAACAVIALLLAGWVQPAVGPVLRAAAAPKQALILPKAEGLSMTRRQYRARKMADLEALVAHLRAEHPAGAPVLLLSNQAMVLVASGHPPLYPEHEYYLSLVGWQMLPERDLIALDEPGLIARLRERSDALVIQRDVDREDDTARHYRASLPELWAFVEAHYEERERFGVYRVLAPAAH